jgi:putative oxidoreductase
MVGWLGGYGFSGKMGFLTGTMHIPAPFAFVAICAGFFGSLGLISRFLTRIAASGSYEHKHRHPDGARLFRNWSGQQKDEGFEFLCS